MILLVGILLLVALGWTVRWLISCRSTDQSSLSFHKVSGTHYRMRAPDHLRLQITKQDPDEG